RERAGDIILLAQHFLLVLNDAEGTHKRFSSEALQRLERHDWPGNVRELKNVVQRAYIMAEEEIDLATLPPELGAPTLSAGGGGGDDGPALKVGSSLSEAERHLILATLEHYQGDKKKTAEVLGISLKTLYNRLNVYKRE